MFLRFTLSTNSPMVPRYLILLGSVVFLLVFGLVVLTFDRLDPLGFPATAKEMVPVAQESSTLWSPAELREEMNRQRLRLVDLRDPAHFQARHLEEAENVPLEQILEEEYHRLWNGAAKIVLISQRGRTANQAWMLLTQSGYQNLYVLEGGMDAWEAGLGKAKFEDEQPALDFATKMKQ